MIQDKKLLDTIIEGIQQKKGKAITNIDLRKLESAEAENFILCTGNSTSQVAAIADSIREFTLSNIGIKPYNYDGYQNSQWIVIDYGTVYVHIFLHEVREFYNLEQLWNDGVIENIPDLD